MTNKIKVQVTYDKSEEHIVRRLGAAVVELWNHLSPKERKAIFDRSLHVLDSYQTVQLAQQIESFIRKHDGEV